MKNPVLSWPLSASRLVVLGALAAIATALGCTETEPGPVSETTQHWVDDEVIYEVFVRDFTPEGTFAAAATQLPRLKALGVTTVWLMPIYPVGEKNRKGTLGSPYAVRDYSAVNPRFGGMDDFRAFVDAAHELGLIVILDFVANHTAWDNAWVTDNPGWYTVDANGEITHPIGTDWTDVADLNYDEPAVWEAMTNALEFWVTDLDVDGFRCDVAEMVPAEFWRQAIDRLRQHKPLLMLAEGGSGELHEVGFDVTYGWTTYHALKDVWNGAPADTLYMLLEQEAESLPEGALRLRFSTNHDETAWDNPPVVLFGGQQGAMAAAAAALTMPGVPLIYNGQEVGDSQKLRLFEKDNIDFGQNPTTLEFYDALLAIHAESAALRRGEINVLVRDDDVLVHELMLQDADGAGDPHRLLVMVNVRDREEIVAIPADYSGYTYTDQLGGGVKSLSPEATLAPYEIRLLVRE